jgi:hypothetical protein
MKKVYFVQIIILFVGVLVSFHAVFVDFSRFFEAEGTFFKVQNCTVPNPITTPCFYGAFAFLGAFVWSIFILKKEKFSEKNKQENRLSWLLLGGSLFALGNFTKLYMDYLHGSQIGCSGAPMTTPFSTPCFYGLSIFFSALIFSWFILWREGK